MTMNSWGELIELIDDGEEDREADPYWVPEDQRLDTDSEDPASNALGEDGAGADTGDDLDGWKPGDPV